MEYAGSTVAFAVVVVVRRLFIPPWSTVEGPAVLEVVELQGTRVGTDPCGVHGARLG